MMESEELDDLFAEAVRIVCQYDRASAALLQRRLAIGYARAARLIDQLEAHKVLAPSEGLKPREVLVVDAEAYLKNIPNRTEKHIDEFPVNTKDYKPKKAGFLPKEYQRLIDPKEMILGFNDNKKVVKINFDEIGNLLISGSPISKKYELTESYLLNILSCFRTDDLRLILYDSTHSFSKYSKMPHLLSPIINDWEKSISALRWAMAEADRRFKVIDEGFKDQLPEIYFIYVFDFTDIEREDGLKRLTSMAFKAGIHLVVLTDQLSDIPKSVRDNFPIRLAFDKFGDYKANFEFKEITPITTIPVNDSEVDKYLKGI